MTPKDIVMDLTPKASPPGRSLFGCCRPPASPSTDDVDQKHGDSDVVEQMAQRIHRLSTEVTRVEEENIALRSELSDAKNAALRAQEQLSSEIELLKMDLLRSKQDSSAKSSEVEVLRKELATVQKSLDEATTNRDQHVAQNDSILAERNSMRKQMIEFSAAKKSMQREIDSLCNMAEGIAAAKAEEVENIPKGLETESDENFTAEKSARRETPTTAPKYSVVGNSQKELERIGSFILVSATTRSELPAESGAMQRRMDAPWSNAAELYDAQAAEIGNLRLDLESVQELLSRDEKNLDACRSRFDELIENTTPGINAQTEQGETRNRGMAKIGERLAVGKLGEAEKEEDEWECINVSMTQKARGNGIERSTEEDAMEMDKDALTDEQAMREEQSAAKICAENTTENASDQAATKDPVATATATSATDAIMAGIANQEKARPKKKKKKKKLRPRLAPITNSQFGQGELSDDEGLGYGHIAISPRASLDKNPQSPKW